MIIRVITEGDDENIEKFIENTNKKKFPISVEKIDVKEKEYKKKFKYFEIKN